MKKWSLRHVCWFLREHGFGEFVRLFESQHVMGAALVAMQPKTLTELGMTDVAQQERLLCLIKEHLHKGELLESFISDSHPTEQVAVCNGMISQEEGSSPLLPCSCSCSYSCSCSQSLVKRL